VAIAYFKQEMKFSGSAGSFDSNFAGISAKGKGKHTAPKEPGGGPFCPKILSGL
jgi:hypothetical protein